MPPPVQPDASPDKPPRTLVIYAGDAGYAYPMLISARSVKAHASVPFDVWLFAADYEPALFDRTAAAAATFGARVVPLSSAEYMKFDPSRYRTTRDFAHLKPSVLSRLVTGPLIPDTYDQVLYLDGDTLCTGDLAPLVTFRAPAGRLLGIIDSINHLKYDRGRYAAGWRDYITALGVPLDGDWYNSGVMMAERKTWAERGQAALDFFIENIDLCRYPVDSSTNATSQKHWAPISCRWNFMAPMRMWGLDAAIAPRFYHFTGADKPWLGPMDPWRDFWPHYRTMRDDPVLGAMAIPFASRAQVAASNRHRAIGRLKQVTVHRGRAHHARESLLETETRVLI